MQNEEKSKKAWQTPECIDLDVNKTSGSKGTDGAESSTTGVGPSYVKLKDTSACSRNDFYDISGVSLIFFSAREFCCIHSS